jgi:hypothetical protein
MRKFGKLASISDLSSNIMTRILSFSSHYEAKIFAFWPKIVDAESAKFLSPTKISSFKNYTKKFETTLYLTASHPAIALSFEYKKHLLIERINQYFGQEIIHHIKYISTCNLQQIEEEIISKELDISDVKMVSDDEINQSLNTILAMIKSKDS